jgi:hypothetical protein
VLAPHINPSHHQKSLEGHPATIRTRLGQFLAIA